MTQPWFRFYRAAVDNPKVQRLPDGLFKAWVNVLCCTGDDGELPPIDDLAFKLRASAAKVAATLKALEAHGLLVDDGGVWVANDWAEHQRKSDNSNERVRLHRAKAKRICNVTGNDDETRAGNVTGNAPEAEAEAETEKEKGSLREPKKKAQEREPNGTRIPDDWQPSPSDVAFAEASGLDAAEAAAEFRDYWRSIPGAKGRKADWSATFRNSCRMKARPRNGAGHHNRNGDRISNEERKYRAGIAGLAETLRE